MSEMDRYLLSRDSTSELEFSQVLGGHRVRFIFDFGVSKVMWREMELRQLALCICLPPHPGICDLSLDCVCEGEISTCEWVMKSRLRQFLPRQWYLFVKQTPYCLYVIIQDASLLL